MFSLFGLGVQGLLDFGTRQRYQPQTQEPTPAVAESGKPRSKWAFVSRLSDDEYLAILEEKIMRLDAEVAVIDEELQSLRQPPSG